MPTARARIQLRQLAAAALVAAVATPPFNLLTSGWSLRSAVQGVVDAFIVSALVGGYLLFVRDGRLRLWLRARGFWIDLVLSSTIALVLFLLGRGIGQVVTTLDPRRIVAQLGDAHLRSRYRSSPSSPSPSSSSCR